MKTTILILFATVCITLGDSTNLLVRIGGRTQTTSELEQLVIAHARRSRMQFDFAETLPHFTVLTNHAAVISMWCAQTNGAHLFATVDSKGAVRALELTPRDVETIKTVLARMTTDAVTQVWLGPDGVGATTKVGDKDEGEVFWLRRVPTGWKVHNQGTWKAMKPSPDIVPAD